MLIKDEKLILPEKIDRYCVTDLLDEFHKLDKSKIRFFDLSEVKEIDSAGVALLDEFQLIHKAELQNVRESVAEAIDTFSVGRLPKVEPVKNDNIFVKMGEGFLNWIYASKDVLYLLADISFWSVVGLFNKKGQRKGSTIQQSLLIGVDALGIIALLSFILGLILALQSAAQLRQFGANIFVADLMGISMVTEMGPILTSIILAGRTGSSIASEIATMKVTEEIDALKMMAINPIRYIVVPKFHAITLCVPLLVTASILVGIIGGLIVAVTYLDLSWVSFINRIFEVVRLKDLLIGLGKSFFFAWTIVIIGSYYGFKVSGGAEGVGKVTTQAVVASIFWVIILDAINSLIFYF